MRAITTTAMAAKTPNPMRKGDWLRNAHDLIDVAAEAAHRLAG